MEKKRSDFQRNVSLPHYAKERFDTWFWEARYIAGVADPGAAVNARGYKRGPRHSLGRHVCTLPRTTHRKLPRYFNNKVLEAFGFEVSLVENRALLRTTSV